MLVRNFLLIILLILPLQSISGVLEGRFSDLKFTNHAKHTTVHLKGKSSERLVCKWGINGHQWITYMGGSGKSDSLNFDHRLYSIHTVSWLCRPDKDGTHEMGTFKIFPNKYY